MNRASEYDLIILGAGIAGLSVADACLQNGLRCAVVDIQKTGMGASGVTMGLLNPATGRQASKSWEADKAIPYTKELLERVSRETGRSFHANNGVIRPALNREIAGNMRDSVRKNDWPDGWVEWIDKEKLQQWFRGLNCTDGGLWVPVACTVSILKFTEALELYLSASGVDIFTQTGYEITGEDPWKLSVKKQELKSGYLVNCTGSGLTTDPLWAFMPLHTIKGQILNITLHQPFLLSASVSSLGYIANMTDDPLKITIGSTYEHHYQNDAPDAAAADYLLQRHEKTIDAFRRNIAGYSGWAGIRVSASDRKPVAGPHPEIEHLYVLGALGSKGLAQGPYAAKLLADHIAYQKPIPGIINPSRFFT